jgi:cytosine/uracil/thiamine/allantoin permease
MKDVNVKKTIMVIIPTIITYLSVFKDFKIIKDMETWRPIIAAAIVFIIMIYIVYRKTQKEKLLDALQANLERQEFAIVFMLEELKLTDRLNEHFEKLKKNINENKSLAKILIDKNKN